MLRFHRLLIPLSALLVVACLPPKGDLGEYSATDQPDDVTGDASSEGETATGTSGDSGGETSTASPSEGSGVTTTTTSPSSDTDGETDTGPADPGCGVDGPSWELGGVNFEPPLPTEEFAADCQISDIEPQEGGAIVGLQCGEQQASLDLQLDEPLTQLAPGDTVAFDYRAVISFGISEWFTLRRPAPDGTLLLAGLSAETLAPPNADDFFAPLSMTQQEGVCDTPIDCEHMEENLAVNVHHGDALAVVMPTNSAVLGEPAAYRVGVSIARKFHNDLSDGQGGFCSVTDTPEFYFRLIARSVGE